MTGITAIVTNDLIAAVRREAIEARNAGRGDDARRAMRWANSMGTRVASYVITDLNGDPRVVLEGPWEWNRDKGICGLPMVDGVGRVVEIGSGRVSATARDVRANSSRSTRRFSPFRPPAWEARRGGWTRAGDQC